MVLVDTSVWIDHLRTGNKLLTQLLITNRVAMHPMIIGELACGNLSDRSNLLSLWQQLPTVSVASHKEVLHVIEQKQWMGKGIGYIDAHLLAATLLTSETTFWTQDKRLDQLARQLHIGFKAVQ